jgi:hypothetical protein
MFDDDYYETTTEVDNESEVGDIEIDEPEPVMKRDRSKIKHAFYSFCAIFCVMYIITCGCGLFVATFGMNLALFSCFGKECVVLVD